MPSKPVTNTHTALTRKGKPGSKKSARPPMSVSFSDMPKDMQQKLTKSSSKSKTPTKRSRQKQEPFADGHSSTVTIGPSNVTTILTYNPNGYSLPVSSGTITSVGSVAPLADTPRLTVLASVIGFLKRPWKS